jgi:hypothetical protein
MGRQSNSQEVNRKFTLFPCLWERIYSTSQYFLPSLQLAQSVQEEPCSKMQMRIDALIIWKKNVKKPKKNFMNIKQ